MDLTALVYDIINALTLGLPDAIIVNSLYDNPKYEGLTRAEIDKLVRIADNEYSRQLRRYQETGEAVQALKDSLYRETPFGDYYNQLQQRYASAKTDLVRAKSDLRDSEDTLVKYGSLSDEAARFESKTTGQKISNSLFGNKS